MLRAILFDLDDTLLSTGLNTFLPAYLRALAAQVSHLVDPRAFTEALLASTMVMTSPHDPGLTNQQVFEADFFPRVGVPAEVLRPLFDRFYAEAYGSLRTLVSPRPEAPAVVGAAVRKGLDVVIATQPVFPLTAIRQRMQWAGVDAFPYRLVTSYECMHACKPQVEYYLEIAAMIGRAPAECLMVGNDPEQDIAPAAEAGMATYRVIEETTSGASSRNGALAATTWRDVAGWRRSETGSLPEPFRQ